MFLLSLSPANGRGAKDRITIPCGKCLPCKMRKRSSWSFRLVQELRYSKSAYFITLTYDDFNVPQLHDRFPPSWNIDEEQKNEKRHHPSVKTH